MANFHRIGPLGRFGLVVAMFGCRFVGLSPSNAIFKVLKSKWFYMECSSLLILIDSGERYHHYLYSKHRPSGPMLSISRNVHIFVCLFVCLFTFEVPFNGLFAPTSRSRMSNIFRDSESLGKSN